MHTQSIFARAPDVAIWALYILVVLMHHIFMPPLTVRSSECLFAAFKCTSHKNSGDIITDEDDQRKYSLATSPNHLLHVSAVFGHCRDSMDEGDEDLSGPSLGYILRPMLSKVQKVHKNPNRCAARKVKGKGALEGPQLILLDRLACRRLPSRVSLILVSFLSLHLLFLPQILCILHLQNPLNFILHLSGER